jgi:hypothetical protein
MKCDLPKAYICMTLIIFITFSCFKLTNVSPDISDAETSFFAKKIVYLKGGSRDYESELQVISKINNHILQLYPVGEGIPLGTSREPIDLDTHGTGLCYDRSRTLYKAYRWAGFEVRQTFLMYPYDESGNKINPIFAFFSKETTSHAVVEILTKKGWLVVDTNTPWISNSVDNIPISASEIRMQKDRFKDVPWNYDRDFVSIRGLLSRNGHMYPPYISLPDLNWREFIKYNVFP